MNAFSLLSIESGISSLFEKIASFLSFDVIFIAAIALELLVVIIFSICVGFTYEVKARKAFDKFNRWLFVNKRIGAENIKEFNDMVKSSPKRIEYYWQQYILFREKAPSEYLNVNTVIENPLRASSYKICLRNMSIISIVIAFLTLVASVAVNFMSGVAFNASMVIFTILAPFCVVLIWAIAAFILNIKRNTNLDELYQNHHLFQRFVDNACVELPAFIDYGLLFTNDEIEKGIPVLREYYEDRARKQQQEFLEAQQEKVEFEKYNFEDAGIDGSNILERAMNETESYLNNKNKTLAKISQLEASLESLKKNFDNIQKEYQRKMQVYKENIDRLRQQQEETTSRIESNFLRKQQANEITKQEKEDADFEQQKRRYLVEKNDYEQEIKNLNKELDDGKGVVEKAMLAEYQSFYERLCKRAFEAVNQDLKNELSEAKEEKDKTDDELAVMQTLAKRLEDENNTLRNEMGLSVDNSVSRLMPQEQKIINDISEKKVEPKKEEVKELKNSDKGEAFNFVFDEPVYEDVDSSQEQPQEEKVVEEPKAPEKPIKEELFEDDDPFASIEEEPKANVEEIEFEPFEEEEPEGESVVITVPVKRRGRPVGSTKEKSVKPVKTEPAKPVAKRRGRPVGSTKVKPVKEEKPVSKRGRPVGSTKVKPVEPVKEEKPVIVGRGRPKKEKKVEEEPKRRGRPTGTKNKMNSPSVKKRAASKRGRPKKQESGKELKNKILDEKKKMKEAIEDASKQVNKTLKDLESKDNERERLIKEIESLKKEAMKIDTSSTQEEIETLNQKMEELLKQINKLA